jgi:hypothetical protein
VIARESAAIVGHRSVRCADADAGMHVGSCRAPAVILRAGPLGVKLPCSRAILSRPCGPGPL